MVNAVGITGGMKAIGKIESWNAIGMCWRKINARGLYWKKVNAIGLY